MPRNRKKQRARQDAAKKTADTEVVAAEAAAAAAAAADPSHPEYMKAQGNQCFAAKDYLNAIDWFTKAIDIDAENKVYYSNRSAARSACGDTRFFRAALADANKCVELDSNWGKGYFRQAVAMRGLHRIADAKVALQQALELEAGNGQYARLLEQLQAMKEADFMPEPTDEDTGDMDKFELLEEWLLTPTPTDKAVARFPQLYMKRYSENNRGVHCRVDIPADTLIMTIPRRYLITVEMGHESEIGSKMLAHSVDVTAKKHCYLCVYAMADRRNPDSYYQPYYKILPTAYPNMPIFWSEEELSWLQGSYILQQVKDRKKNIARDRDEIMRAAPEFEEFSLEEFMWARMMVASRNFGVKIDGVQTDALVPYADMLNHYRPRETSWTFNQKKYQFTITSLKTLKKGQQVYDSYGKKCNSRFLLNYGFAIESNRDSNGQCHDEVRVRFELDPADPHYGTKLSLLGDGAEHRYIRVSTWYDHKTTVEAFSFLRFVHARGNEVLILPQIGYKYDFVANPILPISARCEIGVLKTLAATYEEQLATYERSMEEDVADIEGKTYEFGSNHRNAIVHLINEKRVCHHYVNLAKVCVPLLQLQWRDCKRVVNKLFREKDDIRRYIDKVVIPLVKKGSSGAATAEEASRSAALAEELLAAGEGESKGAGAAGAGKAKGRKK